jgi:hypothetical protein
VDAPQEIADRLLVHDPAIHGKFIERWTLMISILNPQRYTLTFSPRLV